MLSSNARFFVCTELFHSADTLLAGDLVVAQVRAQLLHLRLQAARLLVKAVEPLLLLCSPTLLIAELLRGAAPFIPA